jgi:hypothetical protein
LSREALGVCILPIALPARQALEGELVKNFLLKRLVIPLFAASALSILLTLFVPDPWRSLLVNLAASFLGSIVTVFFVERILRRGEEQRWERFRGHVGKQVSILANATASSVRNALAIPPPDMPNGEKARDPARMRDMMIGLIEEELLPASRRLEQMDQDDWLIFARNLLGTIRHCELLLSLFGSKLDADVAALVLDLYEKTREVLIPYEIIPDLLGVPFEKLKPNRRGESSVPFVKGMLEGAIRDVEQLLRICVALLREIGQRFPAPNPSASK